MTVETTVRPALARPPYAGLTCLGDMPGPVPLGATPEHADEVFVTAPDGVRLATDVYLPRRPGRCPTILTRLPYDKAGDHAWIPDVAARLVTDGYVVVAQDVRGKGRSEGGTIAFEHESADGAATLDWIEDQPWSNGRVGMFGQSYFGFTQWTAASTGHRALRCIVPQMTAVDIGRDWMYRQGVFQLQSMAEWATWCWVDHGMEVAELDWTAVPVRSLVERWTGRASASYDVWTRRGPRASYWRALYRQRLPLGALRAAVLGVGGFWDVFARGQVRDARSLHRRMPKAHVRLWMSARDHYETEWTHPATPSTNFEFDLAYRDEAVTRYLGPAPEWYHAWLKADDPGASTRGVRFQVAGEGWRDAARWPPAGARRVALFLDPGGVLAAKSGRTRLAILPYRPDDPVPTLDENPWQVLVDQQDRSELDARDDVLRFETGPLHEPLVLVGPAAVSLTVSARGGAGSVHATLVDVWPGGPTRRLSSGAASVGREPRRVRVDLGEICCRLEAGRSLRIDLAGSDFPRHPRAAGGASALSATRLTPGELHLRLGEDASLSFHVVDPASRS